MTNDDTIREQAIEAAAKVNLESNGISKWDKASDRVKNAFRNGQAKTVDAVLAVAGPAYRAEALRAAADDFAVIPHPYEGGVTAWLRARADAEGADHA